MSRRRQRKVKTGLASGIYVPPNLANPTRKSDLEMESSLLEPLVLLGVEAEQLGRAVPADLRFLKRNQQAEAQDLLSEVSFVEFGA